MTADVWYMELRNNLICLLLISLSLRECLSMKTFHINPPRKDQIIIRQYVFVKFNLTFCKYTVSAATCRIRHKFASMTFIQLRANIFNCSHNFTLSCVHNLMDIKLYKEKKFFDISPIDFF